MLKINGLTIDVQPIANGIYKMICKQGEESLVAFGMIPKWSIDLLEKQFRAKLKIDFPWMGTAMAGETIREVVSAVSTGIYAAASEAGKMIV